MNLLNAICHELRFAVSIAVAPSDFRSKTSWQVGVPASALHATLRASGCAQSVSHVSVYFLEAIRSLIRPRNVHGKQIPRLRCAGMRRPAPALDQVNRPPWSKKAIGVLAICNKREPSPLSSQPSLLSSQLSPHDQCLAAVGHSINCVCACLRR